MFFAYKTAAEDRPKPVSYTHLNVDYDLPGSIGKRYRRQDEIGTPYCITVDPDTENDGCVTVRDRDTMEQIRIPMEEVKDYIAEKLIF